MIWTEEKVEILRRMKGEGKLSSVIAKAIGPDCTHRAVNEKARKLGLLLSDEVRARTWGGVNGQLTDEQLAYIRANVARMTSGEIGKALGIGLRVARRHAKLMGFTPLERPSNKAKGPAASRIPEVRGLAADDQNLVADFIAQRGVTSCPRGWAYGADWIQYVGKKQGRAA